MPALGAWIITVPDGGSLTVRVESGIVDREARTAIVRKAARAPPSTAPDAIPPSR
jgi:hypothetical protein